MARSFLSFTLALATATLILFGVGANRASAQPKPDTPTPPTKQSKYPEVQEAFQLLIGPKHDLAGAIKLLKDAARKYPELPSAHVLMSQFLGPNMLNQPAAARFQLEQAINETPNDPEPYIILGSIAMQERRVFEASQDFDKAKQLLPAYTNTERKAGMEQQVLNGTAQVAEAREDWKEAESRLKELLKLAPENLDAHQRLAKSLFWQGKAKEAYDLLKQAKEIDRANAKKNKTREVFLTPEAIMAQYYYQFEGKDSKNPETWYRAALKAAPNDLPTREVVAVWALENGKIDFAKEQAKEALRIEEEDAKKNPDERKYKGSNVGNILRGYVALWEKDWPEAETDFQKVILAAPTDFVARNNIALALVEQDDSTKKNKAVTYAEANYKDNSKTPDALSTLGWVYFRHGDFEKARGALDQAIKAVGGLNSNSPDLATYAAYVLHHSDRDWDAKDILESILKSDRPFSMKPEAQELYKKVKDAKKPEAVAPAATPKTP
ncbi:MAG: tetratricopeptide repeat protein [Thermoguttaceae bacterium]